MDATVPDGKRALGLTAPTEAMRSYICQPVETGRPSNTVSIFSLQSRNAQQDVALAAAAPKDELQKLFGACDAPPSPDPEWYLPIRDYLLRLR
jgi:hypothetical protein